LEKKVWVSCGKFSRAVGLSKGQYGKRKEGGEEYEGLLLLLSPGTNPEIERKG